MTATAFDESVVHFEADGETLAGIVTRPVGNALGVGVIILSGGANTTSMGPRRFSVRLARFLSERGFHTLRFDYHGLGESTGVMPVYRLDTPFVQDLTGAISVLDDLGLRRFILVGKCIGARTALAKATELPGLEGLVLISAPVRDFEKGERGYARTAEKLSIWDYVKRASRPRTLQRLLDPRRRTAYRKLARAKIEALKSGRGHGTEAKSSSSGFLEPLEVVARSKTPVLFIYGEADQPYAEFSAASRGPLGDLLATAASVHVRTLPAEVQGFSRLVVQDQTFDIVGDWIARSVTPEGSNR
jgi:pimeloyl-ACP methyl ester carboxylesterase